MATSTFEKVSDRLHDAGERIVDFKDDASRSLGRRVDALGAMMKKHPLLSIGLGIGVGYLLARTSIAVERARSWPRESGSSRSSTGSIEVEEGSQVARVVVGFGSGASRIDARVQVYASHHGSRT